MFLSFEIEKSNSRRIKGYLMLHSINLHVMTFELHLTLTNSTQFRYPIQKVC